MCVYISICMYVCIHTRNVCIHTHGNHVMNICTTHTHIYSYISAKKPETTSIHKCIHTDHTHMLACMQKCMQTFKSYIHTCVHAYISSRRLRSNTRLLSRAWKSSLPKPCRYLLNDSPTTCVWCTHACMYTWYVCICVINAYVHTFVHTSIQTYANTCVPFNRRTYSPPSNAYIRMH
jgi:hypothetical protein